ncbi:hypothetical protein [Bartonella sp. B1099]|uniref:hypothetical protein n=1 Tax=Bartonella sp. B1099 TaxID=2911422 RepID=UPI0020C28131|nr:hypothetical protein [Bartonella sp. B1099]
MCSPLRLYILPKLDNLPVLEIIPIRIYTIRSRFHLAYEDWNRQALTYLNMCFKHAAALGLDVNIQAATKAHSFQERNKTTKRPAMNRREVPAFL